MSFSAGLSSVLVIALAVCLIPGLTRAQSSAAGSSVATDQGAATIYGQPGSDIPMTPPKPSATDLSPAPMPYAGENEMNEMGGMVFWHVLLNQLEGRSNGPENELRWDGEAWVGDDYNRLWFKSEAFFNKHGENHGRIEDGIHEAVYDRPIPFLRYFDWQAGLRYDGDSSSSRYWGALGIEGLAPEFFEVEATLYARDAGHYAARFVGSYDILLTNRLIAQPQIEMNFYTKEDTSRAVGRGLSELDTGLRVRYEISRKFAPYVGFAYTQQCGGTAGLVRREGDIVYDPRLVFGARVWY